MTIDVIYIICLLVFMIRGYSKGIVVALFSMVAIVLGVTGALKLSQSVSALLFTEGGRWAPLVSYIIVFLLIVWLVKLGAMFVQRMMEAVTLGWLNRLSGALIYGFLVSFVFSSLLWLLNQMDLIRPETKESSLAYSFVEPLAPKVFLLIGHVLPFAKHIFDDLSLFFEQVNRHIQ